MSDDAAPVRLPAWFFAALAALTLVFLTAGIRRADGGTLRGDEVVSHFANTRAQSPGDLLLHGARPQVSPAPLLYLVDQAMHALRRPLGYLGLTPPGYIRLPSLLFTAGLGAAAALLVALGLRRPGAPAPPVALVLVLCGIAVYWFHPKLFPFAGTERPYALWNGFWLFFLAWMLTRPARLAVPAVVLCLMAATSVASCFQILAVGLALLALGRLERRPLKQTLRDGTILLGPAALIGVYYALQTQRLDFDKREMDEAAGDFLRFWLVTQLPSWIAVAAAVALVAFRPELRPRALPALALAALMLTMPLMFSLARSRGYTSPSRQYIWSTTTIPLTLFLAALAWHEGRGRRFAAPLALLAGAGLVAGFGTATLLRAPARNDSRALACLDAGSPLRELLRSERPRRLACPASTPAITVQNVTLLAEWIAIRHRDRPAGGRTVRLREENGRLVADPVGVPPDPGADWVLIPVPE